MADKKQHTPNLNPHDPNYVEPTKDAAPAKKGNASASGQTPDSGGTSDNQ